MQGLIDLIEKQYADKRAVAERNAEEAYKNALTFPSFSQVEKELKETTFLLAKAELFDENPSSAESYRNKSEKLKKKRAQVLKELRIDEKTFIPHYECEKCSDTGYVNGKPCECFQTMRTKLALSSLDLSPLKNLSFSDNKVTVGKLKKIYDKMREYVNLFPDAKTHNFVFSGKCGSGKTFLAQIVASELQKKGYSSVFLTATELNEKFLKIHFTPYSERPDYMSALISCDFLVIDDLGTEPMYNKITVEYLLALVSERLFKNKHTIITTNLGQDEILSRYSERFFSRVTEKRQSAFVSFEDNNFRAKKNL